jgi:hypothetical protein
MAPTMNSQMSMPRAPQMSKGRRPNFSMDQNEMGVEQTLTRVVIKEIRKGLEIVPRSWKKVVPDDQLRAGRQGGESAPK